MHILEWRYLIPLAHSNLKKNPDRIPALSFTENKFFSQINTIWLSVDFLSIPLLNIFITNQLEAENATESMIAQEIIRCMIDLLSGICIFYPCIIWVAVRSERWKISNTWDTKIIYQTHETLNSLQIPSKIEGKVFREM